MTSAGESGQAAELFVRHLARSSDLGADLERLCAARPGLAADLRALAADWQRLEGVLDRLGVRRWLRSAFWSLPPAGEGEEDGEGDEGRSPVTRHAGKRVAELALVSSHRRYEVKEEVARGGQGLVLRVWDGNLRRDLAMKVLRERRADEEEEVGDRAAIAFAAAFYRALAGGRSVQEAFEQGRLAIELEGLAGERVPRLIRRADVDPARVFVLERGAAGASAPAEWLAHAPRPEPLAKGQDRHAVLLHRSPQRSWALQVYDALRQQERLAALAGDQPAAALLERSRAALFLWSEEAAGRAGFAELARGFERGTRAKGPRAVALSLDGSAPPWGKAHAVLRARAGSDSCGGPRAGELLRLLFALHGSEPDAASARFAAELEEADEALARDIQAALLNGRPQEIVELCERGGLAWGVSAAPGCQAADALLRLAALEPALAVLKGLCTRFPLAVRPQQLRALALARRGAAADLDEAQRILARLIAAGEQDPETLGIYARTWTDRYERTRDRSDLLQSRDHFARAFELAPDDAYVGINAAAKSVLAGELERGRELAGQVSELLRSQGARDGYWSTTSWNPRAKRGSRRQ